MKNSDSIFCVFDKKKLVEINEQKIYNFPPHTHTRELVGVCLFSEGKIYVKAFKI